MPTTALPTESHWTGWCLSTAVLHGWTVHTEYEAERANSGWPTLVMLRGPRMVVAKIKAERGEVTKAQQQWIDQFAEPDREVARAVLYVEHFGFEALSGPGCAVFAEPSCANWDCLKPDHQVLESPASSS